MERVRQEIEGEGRQVAAADAIGDPLELAVLLPAGAPAEAPEEHRHRGQGQHDQVDELDPVEGLDPRHGDTAEDPPSACQHQVEPQGEQRRGGQIEERDQPPEPLGAGQRCRKHQEQVERQRRQQDVGDGVEQADGLESEIHRRRRGEQVGRRRGQAPEIEQEALAAAVAHHREQADAEVAGADQGEDQEREVEGHRRAAVADLLKLISSGGGSKNRQLAVRPLLEALGELPAGGDLAAVDEQDLVPGLQPRLGARYRGHGEGALASRGIEAERLEGLNLALDAQAPEAYGQKGECQADRQAKDAGPDHEAVNESEKLPLVSKGLRSTFYATGTAI